MKTLSRVVWALDPWIQDAIAADVDDLGTGEVDDAEVVEHPPGHSWHW